MEITRERKLIFICGAVLLIIGALYRFYPSIVSAVSVSDEIAFKKNHLEKFLQVVDQRAQAVNDNKAFKRLFKQMENRLLTGATSTLAAVEIQDILNTIGRTVHVDFMSMRVMKPKEDEDTEYIRMPVQFSMNSDIIQLKDLIYQIESSSKLLVITGLDVSKPRMRDNNRIRSTVTVEGVMRRPQKEG